MVGVNVKNVFVSDVSYKKLVCVSLVSCLNTRVGSCLTHKHQYRLERKKKFYKNDGSCQCHKPFFANDIADKKLQCFFLV